VFFLRRLPGGRNGSSNSEEESMTDLKSSLRARSLALILFGVVWIIISSVIIFLPEGINISVLPLLVFPAVGLVAIAAGIYPWIAWLKVTRPEIVIDKTTVGVGDTFTVSFSQNFRGNSEVRGIQLALLMRETAHHGSGKNSHTYQHEVTIDQQDHPGQTFEAGETLAFSQPISIPKSGMYTFHAMNNSIDWRLKVKVDIAGWPDYQDSFELAVQPSLAR
jgi:hypothetical protein